MMFTVLLSGTSANNDFMSIDTKTYLLLNRSGEISQILLAASKEPFITMPF